MSEEIELTIPVTPMTASANDHPITDEPPLHQLGARDLAQLLSGFQFLFWGLLVLLAALIDSLITATLRPFAMFIIGISSLAMSSGAWRLHHVNKLGGSWHNRTRDLLVATSLGAYLSLFYIIWRVVPRTIYFLGHAVAFGAVLIALLCLLCLPVAALARAAGRRNLAVQCVAFGTVAVVLLFPAYAMVAIKMFEAAGQDLDPSGIMRTWVEMYPLKLMMIGMLPFSLTLSLLWSAKDLVWERLNELAKSQGPPSP